MLDEFKGKSHTGIVHALDKRGIELQIAIENTLRDFNMGTIVRNANAFGVRHVHVIGRKQWNKRGAMATDKYLNIHYYKTPDEFAAAMKKNHKAIIAIENNVDSRPLAARPLRQNAVLLFGQEGPGISYDLLAVANEVVHIEQFGSTRSVNVGVAAGIAMYSWLNDNMLLRGDDARA